jgi:glutaredoxin-like protein
MTLLKEQDREALRQEFANMTGRTRLLYFAQALGCEGCEIAGKILDEIAPLGDKIELVKLNYAIDREAAARYGIARIPAIAVLRVEEALDAAGERQEREQDYGVRFYGVPSGYEFMALVGAILDVSSGDSHLTPDARALVAQIREPAHFQVFTTPTCPHCPTAVRLAHRMAIENPNVRADMIEVSEYPDLAQRYQVYGVPLTVANERIRFEGGAPEAYFVPAILQKMGIDAPNGANPELETHDKGQP